MAISSVEPIRPTGAAILAYLCVMSVCQARREGKEDLTKSVSMSEESTSPRAQLRRQHVVERATEAFLRHGYQRTTMADIAGAAQISRPTLYLSFPDKESIFFAVIRSLVAELLVSVEEEMRGQASLRDKLTLAGQTWALGAFELVQRYPNAEDLFDRSLLPVEESYAAFEVVIADVIAEPLRASGLSMDERELASMFSNAIRGFSDKADSEQELSSLIRVLAATTAAALGEE